MTAECSPTPCQYYQFDGKKFLFRKRKIANELFIDFYFVKKIPQNKAANDNNIVYNCSFLTLVKGKRKGNRGSRCFWFVFWRGFWLIYKNIKKKSILSLHWVLTVLCFVFSSLDYLHCLWFSHICWQRIPNSIQYVVWELIWAYFLWSVPSSSVTEWWRLP